MNQTVFLSYCRRDWAAVDRLESLLRGIGVDVFRDVSHIQWGQPITDEVGRALTACMAVLVVVSKNSLESAWVAYEIGHVNGANALGDTQS